jgi:hypothetical protein
MKHKRRENSESFIFKNILSKKEKKICIKSVSERVKKIIELENSTLCCVERI